MSICTRCGAEFGCAMAEGAAASEPCWCTRLPPAVAVPEGAAGCWCPACLGHHIAQQSVPRPKVPAQPLK